jgi:hypothetical protein
MLMTLSICLNRRAAPIDNLDAVLTPGAGHSVSKASSVSMVAATDLWHIDSIAAS